MQRPENSNLFCCFLAWRLADYISQRSYKEPLQNNLFIIGCLVTAPYAVSDIQATILFRYNGLGCGAAEGGKEAIRLQPISLQPSNKVPFPQPLRH